jgi:hypothetical protein
MSILRAVGSSKDVVLRDDGAAAHGESAAGLNGHLPRDLARGGSGATNNAIASLEKLGSMQRTGFS